MESVFRKIRFGDRFHRIGVDGRPNRRQKNIRFEIKTDAWERGLGYLTFYIAYWYLALNTVYNLQLPRTCNFAKFARPLGRTFSY